MTTQIPFENCHKIGSVPPISEVPYKGQDQPCWLWTKCCDGGGYGHRRYNGQMQRAHRVSWQLHRNKIPLGMKVLHHCDIRACVNPAHLFIGTQQKNVADMVAKGRQAHLRGSAHGRAKLIEIAVLEIRSDPRLQREIAADYGVDQKQISRIKTGKTWRHVP